jgi:carnitine 3-dehydrogenase
MSDSRYPQVFGDATGALFRKVGINEAYRASGRMYYTVESHVTHCAEIKAMEPFYVTTQVIDVGDRRLHLLHTLYRRYNDAMVATGEQMYIHVLTEEAKASAVDPAVRAKLSALHAAHLKQPQPARQGRSVGMPTP